MIVNETNSQIKIFLKHKGINGLFLFLLFVFMPVFFIAEFHIIEYIIENPNFSSIAFGIFFSWIGYKFLFKSFWGSFGDEYFIIDRHELKLIQKVLGIKKTKTISASAIKSIEIIDPNSYDIIGYDYPMIRIKYKKRKKVLFGRYLNENEAIKIIEILKSKNYAS